jgi:catechol 2,3-dioxygenase-like lactoylglutathione lyase family enzyme
MTIYSDCVGMTVRDARKMCEFFCRNFDFKSYSTAESSDSRYAEFLGQTCSSVRVQTLQLGREKLELRSHDNQSFPQVPADTNGNDRWFRHFAIVTSDIDVAFERIRKDVTFTSTAPQTLPSWNSRASGIRAFKFKSPENHSMELIQFPPGKGKTEWQSKDRLFLGIDHTAISVRSVEASRFFYEKVIGMHFLGRGLNFGLEQSMLDGIINPRVELLSFGVDDGLGLEFLHYIEPSNGRDLVSSSGVNWYFRVVVSDLTYVARQANEHGLKWVSDGIVETEVIPGFRKGLVLRDPDGHVCEVMQST